MLCGQLMCVFVINYEWLIPLRNSIFMMVYRLIVSVLLSDCPRKSRWSGSSWGRWTEWINHRRLIVPGTQTPSMCFLWTDGWFAVFWDGNLLLLKCLFSGQRLTVWTGWNEVGRLNMQHMQHLKLIRLTGAHAVIGQMRWTTETHKNKYVSWVSHLILLWSDAPLLWSGCVCVYRAHAVSLTVYTWIQMRDV